MGMALVKLPDAAHKARHTHGFFDDFDHVVTADRWTLVTTTDGTITVGDAVGGHLAILTAGVTADNETGLAVSTAELFIFAAGKPVEFEAFVQYTEDDTDKANMFVGLSSVVTAAIMQDDGAGPPATYDGVCFFKVDGGTNWQVETSFAGTQTTTDLTAANSLDGLVQTAGGAAFQRLKAEINPKTSTKMDVVFSINDIVVAKHMDITMTTPELMHFAMGGKDGAVAKEETLVCDYVYCYQTR